MAQLTYPACGAEPAALPEAAGAPQAIELRHLRYFAAIADTANNAARRTRRARVVFMLSPLPGPVGDRLRSCAQVR